MLLHPGSPTVSWGASTEERQQGEGGDCPHLLCPCKGPSGVPLSGLRPPAQERCVVIGASPEEGNEGERAEAPLLGRMPSLPFYYSVIIFFYLYRQCPIQSRVYT